MRDDIRGAPLAAASSCRWTGEQALGAGDALLVDDVAIAHFTGRSLQVEAVVRASDREQHRATVRADGFALRGWLSRHALRLRARRPIALAGPHVVIERGSAVGVESVGGALRVRARFSPVATSAPVECDAIEIGEILAVDRDEVVDPVHLRRTRVALYRQAEGVSVGSLETTGRIMTFSRLETREGRVRVRTRGAVSVDGWLDVRDIEEGEGPDCDDCDGYGVVDARDTCDEPSRDPECPDPRSAPQTWTGERSAITTAPATNAPEVGAIDRGAQFQVREERSEGWLSIVPARFAFAPGRSGLWVRRDAARSREVESP